MSSMTMCLLYHDVVSSRAWAASGFQGPDADLYKLDEGDFRAHLDAIGARVAPGPRLFTFDDGGASAVRIGELLSERGWRGCFFVPTNFIGTPGFLSAGGVRLLAAGGHTVGSHSCSHPLRMAALSRARLMLEWADSRKLLEDILGMPVDAASIPGGYYSSVVAETAAAVGFAELFTSEPVAHRWRVGQMRVYGRYSIQQFTTAATAAALAAGDWMPRFQQFAYWNVKKGLKRAGGSRWLRFRQAYLRLRQSPKQVEHRL